jgi:hypothetical protein
LGESAGKWRDYPFLIIDEETNTNKVNGNELINNKMNNEIKKLLNQYTKTTDAVANTFVKKIGMDWTDCHWIGGDSGGILSIGDYFIGMQDIVDGLELDAKWKDFVAWYDYLLDVHGTDHPAPNFKNWLNGCPRVTGEELKRLKEKVEESRKMLIKSIECKE